ncbi:MAG: GTPase family protein [Cyanobacteria bacterium P01_A01_bin.45]
MIRLKTWQWIVLATPIAVMIIFLLVSAGFQIHTWGINWVWAVFTLVLVFWQRLLAKWTKPQLKQIEEAIAQVNEELDPIIDSASLIAEDKATKQVQKVLQETLQTTYNDAPIWEDWQTFWIRCQELIVAVAHIYHPEVKYPLLNIYVPQAYGLIRGTVDDMDRLMQKLSPVLGKVTVGQAFEGYEIYQKLQPSAKKLWRAWSFAQWLLNPAAAFAKKVSKPYSDKATQELLGNLGQTLREAALKNLCQQAATLYGGNNLPFPEVDSSESLLPTAKTQTLREILETAQPKTEVEQKPVNILLAGRTGAGKSSLINTLFESEITAVDVLPSTDKIQKYQWESSTGELLTLWDTPGYEQVRHEEFRELVLEYVTTADLLFLVTPALDPALQMDVDFLRDIKQSVENLPAIAYSGCYRTIAIVTQVDRLRPIREWEPPYNWLEGKRSKEVSIREATEYRVEQFDKFCDLVIPVVTGDTNTERQAWNMDALSLAIVDAIAPAKQLRLAKFLRNLEARTVAASKIIDRYTFQMTTTSGIAAFLKSPVLQFISTMSTGSPTLAYILAEQIPVEQLPIVIGKLQMAYDLFSLLSTLDNPIKFDLLSLWAVLKDNSSSPEVSAWASGHALVEYWTQNLTKEKLKERFKYYLNNY